MNRLRRLGVRLTSPSFLRAKALNRRSQLGETAPTGVGAQDAEKSSKVMLDVPEIAENGAVVPVEITSHVPGTTSIAVVIDKNPFPLTSRFDFKDGALPYVKLNVKMGQSSNIRAIAEANGKHYVAMKGVKVTIGGCGG